MSRTKLPLVPLHQLEVGQYADSFALLVERTRGATREGKPYYQCRFRDRRRVVAIMVWGDGRHFDACETEWRVGQAYKLRGTYQEHDKYGPQFDLEQLRPTVETDAADGFDFVELIDAAAGDPRAKFQELRDYLAAEIGDPPLRQLVLGLLDSHAERLCTLPATQRHFYPFAGGWLAHVHSLVRTCGWLAEHYRALHADLQPPLNRDLILAGAALHDLGRVRELADPLGLEQSIDGRLFGHILLARDMVREAAAGVPELHPQLLQLLEHVILAHLNHPEWGSPRLPVIPEVLILHHADDMDAKLEMYARCLTRDPSSGPFTDRDPILNKQLFKSREV